MSIQRLVAKTLVPCVFLPALAGCGVSSVAKQAFYEVRGAKSKIILIQEPSDDALRKYHALRFDPVATTVGDEICPPELRASYDEHTRELLTELREFYPGDGPALRVSSEILYFQSKGLLSGAECLARVRMHADDQQLVVDAIVRTESKSFRAGGESALAESNVKAIGEFLKKRELEEEEDEEDEGQDDEGHRKQKERKKDKD